MLVFPGSTYWEEIPVASVITFLDIPWLEVITNVLLSTLLVYRDLMSYLDGLEYLVGRSYLDVLIYLLITQPISCRVAVFPQSRI
jgi:hypothetical protein